MKLFPFQAWYPDFKLIESADSFFGAVKDEYIQYKEKGRFIQSANTAVFFYQIKSAVRTYTGLMCAVDIEEYTKGNILKHEKTLAAKEKNMMHLLMERKALVKPVLLTYPKVPTINALITNYIENNDCFYTTFFEEDQQAHFLWKVTDIKIIKKVQSLFDKEVPVSYIADGHHRMTTMSLLHKRFKHKPEAQFYNQSMVTLFGSDQLEILEFNRVVEGLNGWTSTRFLEQLAPLFDIEKLNQATKPNKKHQITLFLNREWYSLTWKAAVLNRYKSKVILDVKLLNQKVLKGILGIKNVRTDQRIEYVGGTKGVKGLEEATLKSENRVGFYLFPVQLTDLMTLADAHSLLPPKSTWFEPRIKNGLVVKSLEA